MDEAEVGGGVEGESIDPGNRERKQGRIRARDGDGGVEHDVGRRHDGLVIGQRLNGLGVVGLAHERGGVVCKRQVAVGHALHEACERAGPGILSGRAEGPQAIHRPDADRRHARGAMQHHKVAIIAGIAGAVTGVLDRRTWNGTAGTHGEIGQGGGVFHPHHLQLRLQVVVGAAERGVLDLRICGPDEGLDVGRPPQGAVPVRIVLVLDDQRVLARHRDHEHEAGYKPKLGHRLLLHRKGGTSSPPCDHEHGGEDRLRTSSSVQP